MGCTRVDGHGDCESQGRAASAHAAGAAERSRTRCGMRLAALLLLAALPAGCAYSADRGRDLLDIVDLKGGRSMGLGAKVEATLYLGAGVGFATLGDTTEWYGRRRIDSPGTGPYSGGLFGHVLLAGFDTQTPQGGPPSQDSLNVLTINRVAFADHDDPAMLDRWRFGGELVLPFVRGGLYLNVGQVLDLVLGLATIDIAGDDVGWEAEPAAGEQPAPDGA